MRAHTFLYEEVDPTREDLASVAQWLRAEPDQIEVHIQQEPIDKFLGQIKEMYGTFGEFPKDERRTNKILRLLKQGATPMPMYVEQGDKDLFVMEGRHRMVAFYLSGMKTVPVAYVSKKLDETINPDILHQEFKHTQEIGDFTLTAETKKGPESTQLEITCYLQGQFVGNADFWIHGDALQSGLTWVSRQHRNLGVASTMYAYAKMLGNDIKPSSNQLHPGKMMWDAWRKSGEAQHLVAETINPDILNKKFNHTQVIGDYTYKASVEIFMDEPLLNIKAYDGNKEIGHIMFEIFDWEDDTSSGYMESGGTEVDPKYRNKGVASTMYAYAKMLGNDIRPSFQRTTAGRGMWDAWRKSGEAQHLVAESAKKESLTELFQEDSHSMTRAQSRVYDSLADSRFIIDDDGYWYITQDGADYLNGSKEELTEYEHGTDNSKQIFSKLEGLGYKKLGSGQDATVWAKDENHVIKILMPRRTLPSEVANAELGFITFYDFCKKHPELPNLPRFIDIGGQGHAAFEINGAPYRQIAMERLQQIPRGSFEEGMVWMLADLSKYGASWPNIVHQMKNPVSWTGYSGPLNMAAEVNKQFADQAVSTRYGILSVTMGRLYRAGLKSGLGWDLHTENAMMRQDGTVVIVDPFYT